MVIMVDWGRGEGFENFTSEKQRKRPKGKEVWDT